MAARHRGVAAAPCPAVGNPSVSVPVPWAQGTDRAGRRHGPRSSGNRSRPAAPAASDDHPGGSASRKRMPRSVRLPRIGGRDAPAPRFGGTGREPATVHRRHPLRGVMALPPAAVHVRAGRRREGRRQYAGRCRVRGAGHAVVRLRPGREVRRDAARMTGNRTDGDLNGVPDPAHGASRAPVPRNGETAQDPESGSSGAGSGAVLLFPVFPAVGQPCRRRTGFPPDTGSGFPCGPWAGTLEVKSAPRPEWRPSSGSTPRSETSGARSPEPTGSPAPTTPNAIPPASPGAATAAGSGP